MSGNLRDPRSAVTYCVAEVPDPDGFSPWGNSATVYIRGELSLSLVNLPPIHLSLFSQCYAHRLLSRSFFLVSPLLKDGWPPRVLDEPPLRPIPSPFKRRNDHRSYQRHQPLSCSSPLPDFDHPHYPRLPCAFSRPLIPSCSFDDITLDLPHRANKHQ